MKLVGLKDTPQSAAKNRKTRHWADQVFMQFYVFLIAVDKILLKKLVLINLVAILIV